MNHKTLILIIEDEESIAGLISSVLRNEGYKTITSGTVKEGLSMITSHCPNVILLDLGLPDADGIQVLLELRKWSDTPVIVISARAQEEEKVQALNAGADDYIVKPFGTSEMVARIQTALRHSIKTSRSHTYQSGAFLIDFDKHQVSIAGKHIHLTQIEYKIVALLAQNAGKVLTYDKIIANIWGPYADTNNRILRVNMVNIRRKIEKNPADPQYIYTEVGVGYRFIEDDDRK